MSGSRKKPSLKPHNGRYYMKRHKSVHQNADSIENTIEVTKIIDLNYDCLEKIFDRLDFVDFFSLALSNKSLQSAAVSAFNRKCGVKKIYLDPMRVDRTSIDEVRIIVFGLRPCLQLVRCFGEKLTGLTLINGSNKFLDQYIHQYCSRTLLRISLLNRPPFADNFRKRFIKVNVVKISMIELQERFQNFCNWFPCMRHLIISDGVVSDRFSAVRFSRLEHLTISAKNQMNYVEFVRANPQLKTIEFTSRRMAMKRSLDVIEHNHSISKLEISHSCRVAVCVYPNDAKRLVRDHPLLIEVDLPWHQFKADGAIILVRQLNALKIFRFAVNSQSECDDILKQLDCEWNYEVQPTKLKFMETSYLCVKLSR